MSRLHVAFDARYLASPVSRGMDRYLLGLTAGLCELDVQVTWLTRDKAPIHPHRVVPQGVRIVELADRSVIHWEQVALPLHLRQNRYDIYHAPAERGVPFVCPIPKILTLHSLTYLSYESMIASGRLKGTLDDYLDVAAPSVRQTVTGHYYALQMRSASHVLTPSRFSAEELICLGGYAREKVTVTPLAVDASFHRPRQSPTDIAQVLARYGLADRRYILNVGGFERHKNVEGLLEMFALLQAQITDLLLVVIGTGNPSPSVLSKCDALGLKSNVRFLSNVTDDLVSLYDGAKVFATLSWRETFCLPILEAMSRGLSVVASCWGAAPEVGGDQATFVDPRQPAAAAAVANAMRLSDNETAAAAIKQASRFNWNATAALTLAAYREAIRVR